MTYLSRLNWSCICDILLWRLNNIHAFQSGRSQFATERNLRFLKTSSTPFSHRLSRFFHIFGIQCHFRFRIHLRVSEVNGIQCCSYSEMILKRGTGVQRTLYHLKNHKNSSCQTSWIPEVLNYLVWQVIVLEKQESPTYDLHCSQLST